MIENLPGELHDLADEFPRKSVPRVPLSGNLFPARVPDIQFEENPLREEERRPERDLTAGKKV